MNKLPVQDILHAARQFCGPLSGAYVHGSVCLNGYVEGKSDLDVLIVCERPMSADARIAFADALLRLHGRPCPIELSVLTQDGVMQSPPLCTFHFSSLYAPLYAAHDESNPLLHGEFPDGDIPSYLRLIRQSGIRLCGEEARTLLPEVSDEAFWRSISDGIESFDFHDYGLFHSNILTLSRIASFAHTRKILTKVQGAQWGMHKFPEFAGLLSRAIDCYACGAVHEFSEEELSAYRTELIKDIRKGLR